MVKQENQIIQIRQAIAALEAQRGGLGDSVVDAAILTLQKQLSQLDGQTETSDQQRKLVTVLFADLVSFTALSEERDPEDLRALQQAYFNAVTPPILEQGGKVEKYIGDAVLAIFGFPQAQENDPERAIRAGLEMQQALGHLNKSLESEWGLQLHMRIGINTGPVFASMNPDGGFFVTGDTVNTASRLQNAAPEDGLLISYATYRHVRGVFDVQELEPIRVKGKSEPVQIYRVMRAKPRAFWIRSLSVEGVETRMVGREAELNALKDAALTLLEEREGQVITILGEAGIGKTRLAYEFLNWVELRPERVWFFQARAREESYNQANALLRDLFVSRFEIRDDEPVEAVRKKVETGFGAILGTDPGGVLKSQIVGQLLGFDFRDSQHQREILEDPEQLHSRGLAYLEEYLRGLSQRYPVLLVVDDIHWVDDSSLDILDSLGTSTPEKPILLVCIARTSLLERRPFWGEGQPYHTRLELQPLSKRESRHLAAEILKKMEQIPVALRELLVGWSEGNPFYMEELVKMLLEQGVIVKGESRWEVAADRFLAADIPATLTGVIQARLDGLPAFEREVLQEASVVGQLFWEEAVAHLHPPESQARINQALSSLRDRELIYRHESSSISNTQEFVFKHTLLREVVYESLLKRKRKAYHGKVAEWMIQNSGQRENELFGAIASHFDLAGEAEQSASYYIKAGDQARTLYAHSEAERYYRQAIQLLNSHGQFERAAKTLLKLGLVYTASFDTEKARETYQAAFDLWEPLRETIEFQAIGRPAEVLLLAAEQPSELDPGAITTDDSIFIASQLFEGLVRIDENHNILPAVASRWEVNSDGKEYLFYLNPDARWSDGEPLTAADFEFAWKRNLDPGTSFRLANLLSPLENASAFLKGTLKDSAQIGVKALDKSTLWVRLEHPSAYLPYLLSHSFTYPLPRWAIERHKHAWTSPDVLVGNGPYRLLRREDGPGFLLARNPHYSGSFPGNVERVECIFFPGYDQALDIYEKNQIDAVSLLSADPEAIARAKALHGQELVQLPQLSTFYLSFRLDRPPFNDILLRKAFIQSVHRQALVQQVFEGQRLAAHGGFLPPGMPGYSPEIGLPYNPDEARRALAQAGYPDGQGFPEVKWLHSAGGERVIEFLQREWKKNLGLDLHPQSLDWGRYLQALSQDPPDLWLNGWTADFPDPDCMLRVTFHSDQGVSSTRWRNADFDSLVEQAECISDYRQRIQLYQQADRILVAEEAVVMPLTYGEQRMLVKAYLSLPKALSIQMPLNQVILNRR